MDGFVHTAIKCIQPVWKIQKFCYFTWHLYFWGSVVSSFL